MATRAAVLPGWVKATLWAVAVLVGLAMVLVAFGHSPLQHLFGHTGMTS